MNRISVKQHNRKIILTIFRRSEILSVTDIVRETGISKPTVQKTINHFEGKSVVEYAGKGYSTEEGGKRPNLYRFNPVFGSIISIHVGPDFIYGAITDMNANILHSHYIALRKLSVEKVVDTIVSILNAFNRHEQLKKSPAQSIVLGLPGIVDLKNCLLVYSPHISEPHQDSPIVEMVRSRSKMEIPVFCEGINRLQAFAEMKKGIAKGVKNFMILDAMKEGLGSGIVINGSLRHGTQSLSGEVGHMILQPHGPKCICGGEGCFEAMVSMKQVHRMIKEGRKSYPNSEVFQYYTSGMDDLTAFFESYKNDDELAKSVLTHMAQWFAIGINNLIMVNDPRLIILQGIYNSGGELFVNLIMEKLGCLSLPYIRKKIEIELSRFGDERGVIGGACFGVSKYFETLPLGE